MIRVVVQGAAGRMGAASVAALGAAEGIEVCAGIGRDDDLAAVLRELQPDVLVEFTRPDAVYRHVELAFEHGVDVVSGTTGLSPADLDALDDLARRSERGAVIAPNFALGVVLMQRFAAEAVRWFGDVEIVELHHDRKIDAPSGTARDTARRIAEAAGRPLNDGRPAERIDPPGARGAVEEGVPMHALRLPGLIAHQEVLFGGDGELLTIRHDTLDRRAFMPGVVLAVRRVPALVGLLRSLHEVIDGADS